jgi:hypothetical protein
VNEQGDDVSVSDIATALDISDSYARDLAREAVERELIDGDKSAVVIGYVFGRERELVADGGSSYDGELRVIPTREGLLEAVDDYASERLDEALAKNTLDELRTFVRRHVADETVPVGSAWRFRSRD